VFQREWRRGRRKGGREGPAKTEKCRIGGGTKGSITPKRKGMGRIKKLSMEYGHQGKGISYFLFFMLKRGGGER